jgi:hypothetical protein
MHTLILVLAVALLLSLAALYGQLRQTGEALDLANYWRDQWRHLAETERHDPYEPAGMSGTEEWDTEPRLYAVKGPQ